MRKPLPIIFYSTKNNDEVIIATVSLRSRRDLKRKMCRTGEIIIREKIQWSNVPAKFYWAKEYLAQIEAGSYDFAIIKEVKREPLVEVFLITTKMGSSRSVPMLLGKGK